MGARSGRRAKNAGGTFTCAACGYLPGSRPIRAQGRKVCRDCAGRRRGVKLTRCPGLSDAQLAQAIGERDHIEGRREAPPSGGSAG